MASFDFERGIKSRLSHRIEKDGEQTDFQLGQRKKTVPLRGSTLEDKKRRLGTDGAIPKRPKYKQFSR